ncbi:MAG TPA: hypothetical protein VNC84_03650 [Gammaproteobacteria bacterium]|jgi:hypothetical protein|nr:hypothetical protein [Gammaproteobacteria bacterium]
MIDFQVKIFLIIPIDKKYKAKIVYADDEGDARNFANAEENPAGSPTPPDYQLPENHDNTYKDKSLSTCEQIFPKIIESHSSILGALDIEYKGKRYYLIKGDAVDIDDVT